MVSLLDKLYKECLLHWLLCVQLAGLMTDYSTPTDRLPAHIPALDGIRGLAVLLVLIRHLVSLPIEPSVVPGNWQYYVWYWTKTMWVGVDLFFVLSGFLITKILLENQNSQRLFRTFYSRRACRILPFYILILACVFTAQKLLPENALWHWLFDGRLPLATFASFTQNFVMGAVGNTGGLALSVTWSLAVEEQFYLLLPITLRLVSKNIFPWLCAGGFVWAYLARMHWKDARSFYWTPAQADALLTGCLVAWICLQPSVLRWLKQQGRGMTVLLGILAMAVLFMNRMPNYYTSTFPSLASVFFGLLILIVVTQKNHLLARCLEVSWLGYLGKISYAVYLLHFPLLGVAFWYMRGTIPVIHDAGDMVVPLVALVATLILASLSWYFFEKPLVQLGHRAKY